MLLSHLLDYYTVKYILKKKTRIITNQYINTIYFWEEDLKHVTSDRKTSIYHMRIVCRGCNSTPGTEEHFAVNRYLWPPTFVNSVTRALPRVIWNLSKISEKTRPITLIHFVKKAVHLIENLITFFRQLIIFERNENFVYT